ncbi:Holliday junction resolvase RuvX [Terriglobus roseus]|uniref:Putative pre-16S rRNA nuclease n=1 Tax=Terriglobus roseus TaxID=392734 RepID=A0A1H4NAM8_9BACT|nr:Holliday junction resolvase RuvX [Terriglobus roseus]SEB92104.1 putative holliday junction resolvase [Terriglobus roseus]
MKEFPRILGLDIGDRRIGIALTDALGTAQPLLTLGRTHLRKELKDLARMVRKHGVTAIVAGDPVFASGDLSPQAKKAQEFAQTIADELQIPVHLQRETLTSAAAEELLDRRGFPRGPERKAVLDQYAAVVILQDWLDGQESLRMRAENAG